MAHRDAHDPFVILRLGKEMDRLKKKLDDYAAPASTAPAAAPAATPAASTPTMLSDSDDSSIPDAVAAAAKARPVRPIQRRRAPTVQERDRAIRRDRRSREDERVAGIIRAQGAAAAMALMQGDPAAQMAARAQAVAESINALPEVRAAVGQQRGAELAHRIQSHRAELQIQRAATAAESRMLAGPVVRGAYARVAQASRLPPAHVRSLPLVLLLCCACHV